MTWVKLDDGFPEHPKVIGLSDGAFRLHVAALAYSARRVTDGVIPHAALPALYQRSPDKLAAALVTAGLWHQPGHECGECEPVEAGTYLLHGFLNYNPSREQVTADRDAARERMRRARQSRSGNVRANIQRSSPEVQECSPNPTRPDPNNKSVSTSSRANPQPVENIPRCEDCDSVLIANHAGMPTCPYCNETPNLRIVP